MTKHEEHFAKLSGSFDGERCLGRVAAIHNSDRWFDFKHFKRTAEYCAAQMEAAGLTEIELLPLKADGRTRYGDWVLPQAWDVRGAQLRFAEGGKSSPLADYSSDPCSLMMLSAPTPAGGFTAPVAAVDDPGSVIPGSLRGKLILTGARPGGIVELAKREGAAGVLCDWFPLFPGVRDSAEAMAGHSRWENDFIHPVNDTGLYGFSLSPEAGGRLRAALADAERAGGEVLLRAWVDAALYDGVCHTVSGLIPGSEPDGGEVLLCGHLYEPGANDNASGCGALLELAACIRSMIGSGSLPRPRLGLRFVMGFECAGLMGYAAHHKDRIARMAAGISMDMVGAAASDKSVLHIWHDPLTNWSQIDELLPKLAGEYRNWSGDEFDFEETPFTIGDNLLADPTIGVPTVSMVMHPAESYHSSLDGIDRVDANVLKRNSVIAGAAALLTAQAGRLPASRRALPEGVAVTDALRKASISEAMRRAPVRLTRGTVTLAGLPGRPRESLKWYPYYDYNLNCPLFYADGRRTLGQIAALSAMELGVGDISEHAADLSGYFELLEELGYIKFC